MKSKTVLHLTYLLAGVIAPFSLSAQSFTFSTIAGGSSGLLDGSNTAAQFSNPTGVAVDSAGNVFVADQGNNALRLIIPLGTNWIVSTIAGGAPGSLDGTNTSAQFYAPAGVVVAGSGKIYVTDQYNSTIRQIIPAGGNWIVSTIAGTAGQPGPADGTNASARFSEPAGIAADAAGNLYVADEGNNALRKLTPSGTNWIVTTIAGGAPGKLDGTNTAAQFDGPCGVAVDATGRLLVADQFNNTIRLLTPSGTNWVVSTIAGDYLAGRADGTGTNAEFDAPLSLAVDSNNNVYVADSFNEAIRKMTPVGTNWMVATIAGGLVGSANGTGTNAQFNLPFGVTADAFGDVFVADLGNNAVRLGVAADSAAPTGGLQVTITPAGAITSGAQWQLDGGTPHSSSTILSSLVPGLHTVTFTTVAGFTTPALQIIPITAHQTNQVAANYSVAIANAGSLQVLLSPAGAVSTGVQWQVDGGAFQTNEAVVAGLSAGSHTVSFATVAGWTAPASQNITITNGQTTLVQANYVLQAGSLQVTLMPATVVTAGAQWQVDGGVLHASGATVSGLSPGSHTLSFNTVLGWSTPSNQVVTITNNLTTTATAGYSNFTPVPELSEATVAGGGFKFVLSGQAGSNYVIQVSTDLVAWAPYSTNTASTGGSILINDPGVANHSCRFYRAMMP